MNNYSSSSDSDDEQVETNSHEKDTFGFESEPTPDMTYTNLKTKQKWNKTNLLSLVVAVRKQSSIHLEAFTEETIDWKQVESDVGMSNCEAKFKYLLSSIRHYRTMNEITTDMLALLRTPEIVEANKVVDKKEKHVLITRQEERILGHKPDKKKRGQKDMDPDHPKKPRNGYAIFTSENMKDRKLSMVEVSSKWKQMSAQEKSVYAEKSIVELEQFVKDMDKYVEDHPHLKDAKKERDTARKNIDTRRKKLGMSVNSSTITNFFQAQGTEEKRSSEDEDLTQDPDTSCLDSTVMESPKKRSHTEESSPKKSPKKRKKHMNKTASDVYVAAKREEYHQEHPDYDEEKIKSKLLKKFDKLSESKKAKYQRLADEENS